MSALKLFYIGVKGVVVNPTLNKALVMSKLDNNNRRYWDIPGGRINDDEKIEQTLHRELQEEIPNLKNFTVKNILNAYRLSHDLKDGNGLTLLFFKVEADLETVDISSEHDQYRWVSFEELDSLNSEDTYIEEGYLKALKLALS